MLPVQKIRPMQADEFEKKIQNKLEGFELMPAGEVWKQVAIRIEKDRKKQRVLMYWFLAGFVLLAGSSAYWLINNESNRNLAVNEVNTNTNISKKENYKAKRTEPNSLKSLNKVQKVQTPKNIAYLKKAGINRLTDSEIKNKADAKIIFAKPAKDEQNVTFKTNINDPDDKEQQIVKALTPHKFYNPALASTAKTDTVFTNNNINEKKNVQKDTAAATIAKETIQTKKESSKKWKVGFALYSGISNNLSGLSLSQEKSLAQDRFSPNSAVNNGNNIYNTTAITNFKRSFSFGFGILLQKPLTTKIRLSAGIDYHLYIAKSIVGSKVNQQRSFYDSALQIATSVNSFYTTGYSTYSSVSSLVKYSNKYHLVELPVNLGYQLNKNSKKPFLISAGISPGYLISTNALYANQSANVYYADKQKFHHFLLASQVGFSFLVFSSSGYLISAGPVVQYSFTNVTKAGTGSNQHLFFTGIKANILFK
jgi:hypothetical protein